MSRTSIFFGALPMAGVDGEASFPRMAATLRDVSGSISRWGRPLVARSLPTRNLESPAALASRLCTASLCASGGRLGYLASLRSRRLDVALLFMTKPAASSSVRPSSPAAPSMALSVVCSSSDTSSASSSSIGFLGPILLPHESKPPPPTPMPMRPDSFWGPRPMVSRPLSALTSSQDS